MTTQESLLDAIRRDPADDTVRLVYADWLDEQGGDCGMSHAKFIRRQLTQPLPVQTAPLIVLVEWEHVLGKQPHQCARTAGLDGSEVEGDGVTLVFRRGFVDEVRCDAAALLGHAAAIFAHPVTRVVLDDFEPLNNRGVEGYFGGSDESPPTAWYWVRYAAPGPRMSWEVPAELWGDDLGDWFPSEDAAHDALNARVIAYGRAQFAGSRGVPA